MLPTNSPAGIGPQITYSDLTAGRVVGETLSETITCDNGQSVPDTVIIAPPLLTASPAALDVLKGSCATSQYAIADLTWTNAGDGYCDGLTYTLSKAPLGVTVYMNNESVMVCDASEEQQSFNLEVTSNGCAGVGPVMVTIGVTIEDCVPQTSCGNSCQAATPDGCGGTFDCSSSCTGNDTCTAPQGTTAGLLCCGPGQYIPAGGTSCVCTNGGTWSAQAGECIPPPPTCPAKTAYCAATDSCLTPGACARQSGGGCKANTCK